MLQAMRNLLESYVAEIHKIYGTHVKQIILYGSYARGDYTADSDVDIMILLDMSDMEIKEYQHRLSDLTYDYNLDHDLNIKPVAKNEEHFMKWIANYPFYANVQKEGVSLYV